MATVQEFLVKDLTDWVYQKNNSKKTLAPLQFTHFVGVPMDN